MCVRMLTFLLFFIPPFAPQKCLQDDSHELNCAKHRIQNFFSALPPKTVGTPFYSYTPKW